MRAKNRKCKKAPIATHHFGINAQIKITLTHCVPSHFCNLGPPSECLCTAKHPLSAAAGDVETKELTMTKMKKQALLIALGSALALGAVTSSFAQEAQQYGNAPRYAPNGTYSGQYAPSYGNEGGGNSGGSDY
jgi:hypothetical protein